MKVLVTGGAGFIGSHTAVELLKLGHEVIIVDDFRNSERTAINGIEKIAEKKVILYDIDCIDRIKMSEVFEKERPDGVIHFAAYKAVGESVEKPLLYFENNIQSLVILLDIMEKYGCTNLVFSSSCTVYGQPKEAKVDENCELQTPESPYGYTKVVCERILSDLSNSASKVNSIALRYFNPVGAHPSGLIGELPIGVPNNLVPYITQTAAGIRSELTIFGADYSTPDGTCIRDYIHVCDLAKAHVNALNHLKTSSNKFDAYNVGTGKGTSVKEMVSFFEEATGLTLAHKYGPRREGDVREVFADNKKIVNDLGWQPEYSAKDALLHAWNWQKTL